MNDLQKSLGNVRNIYREYCYIYMAPQLYDEFQ